MTTNKTGAHTADLVDAWREHRDAILRQKPSARKSFGAFKPVIVRENGSTEICGQDARVSYREWMGARPDPKTMYVQHRRGVTFNTRAEAIAYARKCIAASAARMDAKIAEYNARRAAATGGTP